MNKQKLNEIKRRAQECSDGVVARRHMCAGCTHGQFYCDVTRKFNEAYPDNLLNQLLNDPRFLSNVTIFRLG